MEGFSLRDWALIHFLTWIVPHTAAAGFKFAHVHRTRYYLCRSQLDGFAVGRTVPHYVIAVETAADCLSNTVDLL